MLIHFHLGRRARFPVVFLITVFLFFGACYGLFSIGDSKVIWQPKSAFELIATSIGAAAAFVFFLYSQHHQDTQMFCKLFEKFNARYDGLNEKLNSIISRPTESTLISEHVKILYDYFNLCAEEHLFYKAGYIDERVWRAWLQGMKFFAADAAVRRLWAEEIKSGSYYEFDLKLLDAVV